MHVGRDECEWKEVEHALVETNAEAIARMERGRTRVGRDKREWKEVERAWVETNASGKMSNARG